MLGTEDFGWREARAEESQDQGIAVEGGVGQNGKVS